MEETMGSGYQDFVAAFDGDGNQTVTDQETGAQTSRTPSRPSPSRSTRKSEPSALPK